MALQSSRFLGQGWKMLYDIVGNGLHPFQQCPLPPNEHTIDNYAGGVAGGDQSASGGACACAHQHTQHPKPLFHIFHNA